MSETQQQYDFSEAGHYTSNADPGDETKAQATVRYPVPPPQTFGAAGMYQPVVVRLDEPMPDGALPARLLGPVGDVPAWLPEDTSPELKALIAASTPEQRSAGMRRLLKAIMDPDYFAMTREMAELAERAEAAETQAAALAERLARAEAALRPFALDVAAHKEDTDDVVLLTVVVNAGWKYAHRTLTVGHFRAARAALGEGQQ